MPLAGSSDFPYRAHDQDSSPNWNRFGFGMVRTDCVCGEKTVTFQHILFRTCLRARRLGTMRYTFSDIPNTDEGRLLVDLMRKYLNKKDYRLRARGQYRDHSKLKDGERFSRYNLKLDQSKCIRVYIDDLKQQAIESEARTIAYKNYWR